MRHPRRAGRYPLQVFAETWAREGVRPARHLGLSPPPKGAASTAEVWCQSDGDRAMGCLASKQLIERDRQAANPHARSIIDCVGDGGAGAGDADLAYAAYAKGTMRVADVGPDDVDGRHVEVHRQVVLGKRRVHDAASALVEQGLLGKSQADTHDDAAAELTSGGLGI